MGNNLSSIKTTNTPKIAATNTTTNTAINSLSNNDIISQTNQLIEASSDAILCGPDCQKSRNNENYTQAYLNAQTNLQNAPQQLMTAEKNYYINVKGQNAYNNYLDETLNSKINLIGNSINQKFNQSIQNGLESSNYYTILNSNYNYINNLYDSYVKENIYLKNKINSLIGDVTTNDRKTFYESQNYDYLLKYYKIYRWIYILLLITFFIAIFLADSSYSFTKKIIIFVLFLLYPIFITAIVYWIWKIILRIQELLPSNIYKSL